MKIFIDSETGKVKAKHFDHQQIDDKYPEYVVIWVPDGTECKINEIIELTTEQQSESTRMLRQLAYKAEADGLYLEAIYDGGDLDLWRSKVQEIKNRYPK